MLDASSSRSSSPVTEGAERWRASLPPRESFSDAEGANQDGEWVYCIVGEEVDCRGIVWYEVGVV
ncbi:hypothetical protein B0H34DRAFT_717751 [Crassisporium funariophilum]|nr:hypothetical protein B0H34DRAFT_717751 [Crassisporium funariophilum]